MRAAANLSAKRIDGAPEPAGEVRACDPIRGRAQGSKYDTVTLVGIETRRGLMKRVGLIVALPMFLVAAPLAVAEPVTNDMAVRIELHAINTMTLSDAEFLTGDANGKATVTTGQLRIAAGSGRLPVVVLQHGSGGMAANIDLWERELNAIGVSTFCAGLVHRPWTHAGKHRPSIAWPPQLYIRHLSRT